jgi:putative hydrolase of the HAD superfamily
MERSRPSLLVFDLGEVLATPPRLMHRLAERIGVDHEAVSAAYWRYRDAYDRGSSTSDYWRALGKELDVTLSDTEIDALAAFDADAWTELRHDALEVLFGLQASQVRVAILSNAPRVLAASVARRDWSRLVERIFVTGHLTVAKPDTEVFALVTDEMGIAPADVLFFDDRVENVEAARQGGWDAVLWLSPGQMRSALVDRGLLPATFATGVSRGA